MVSLIASAAFIEGALDVLVMVVAIDLVGAGATEVGALTSAAGLGGIIGAAAAVALVGRARLAGPFAIGLLTWGIPVALLGVVPGMITGLVAFLVAGAGRGALDVAGRTLLQRVTPDAALPGVFGVLEGAYMGTIAIGSIAVPAIMALAGPSSTLVVVGSRPARRRAGHVATPPQGRRCRRRPRPRAGAPPGRPAVRAARPADDRAAVGEPRPGRRCQPARG